MVRASVSDLGMAGLFEHTKSMAIAARQFALPMRARWKRDGCANSHFCVLLLREEARIRR